MSGIQTLEITTLGLNLNYLGVTYRKNDLPSRNFLHLLFTASIQIGFLTQKPYLVSTLELLFGTLRTPQIVAPL